LIASGINAKTLNLGHNHSGPSQHFLRYKKIESMVTPDMVVLAFYPGNDYGDYCEDCGSTIEVTNDGMLRQKRETAAGFRGKLTEQLSSWFPYFYQSLMAARTSHEYDNTLYCESAFTDDYAANWRVQKTFGLLKQMNDYFRARGISFLILYIPIVSEFYPLDWVSKEYLAEKNIQLDKPRDEIRLFCENNNIEFIDLRSIFSDHLLTSDKRLYHEKSVDNHFNAAGHRLAASSVRDYLLAKKLTDAATAAGAQSVIAHP
jgi:hypothetical protein